MFLLQHVLVTFKLYSYCVLVTFKLYSLSLSLQVFYLILDSLFNIHSFFVCNNITNITLSNNIIANTVTPSKAIILL